MTWRLQTDQGATTVEFDGNLNEEAELAPLGDRLLEIGGRVVFDLAKIDRVNSCGVREWVNFISRLHSLSELVLVKCSVAMVTNLSMIANFRGCARVESFYAPYYCVNCDTDDARLLEVSSVANGLPSFCCEQCKQPLELNEIPERYLAFLKEP